LNEISKELRDKGHKLSLEYTTIAFKKLFNLDKPNLIIYKVIPIMLENEFKNTFEGLVDFILISASNKIPGTNKYAYMFIVIKCSDQLSYDKLNKILPKCLWTGNPKLSIDTVVDDFVLFVIFSKTLHKTTNYSGLYIKNIDYRDFLKHKVNILNLVDLDPDNNQALNLLINELIKN